jgi:hypothetical protein
MGLLKIEYAFAFQGDIIIVVTLLWPSVGGEAQHLEKVRIWSPPRLPNVQSSIARPKTPRIEVFLVSLERSWSVDIENGLALVIWTSVAQVMGKRRSGSQTGTKSRESTSSQPPNWECDTSLKRSRRGLQVWFRPRRDQTLQSGVMSSQSPGTPPGTISGQFRDSNLGVPGVAGKSDIRAWVPRRVTEYTIGNKVVAYSWIRAVVCLVVQSARGPKCPWLVPTPKGVLECELTTWVVCFDSDSNLIN